MPAKIKCDYAIEEFFSIAFSIASQNHRPPLFIEGN